MTITDLPYDEFLDGIADLMHGNSRGGELKDCPGNCGRKTRFRRCWSCELKLETRRSYKRRKETGKETIRAEKRRRKV